MKVKELISKLQQCNEDDEVSMLCDKPEWDMEGSMMNFDLQLVTDADGKIFITPGNCWYEEERANVADYVQGLIEL